ncbi:MAG TPA: NAD+ synthase [Phycisphaerae bacterium]|nr:NAD+ synthase [Phycisphaerae bacterium]HPS52691.1 NAD+ synthase [Phycisphaerae bacterium]
MKIALAQINPTVGDLEGNYSKMAAMIDRAANLGAELVVFGELSVMGYPPRDLLSRESFIRQSQETVERLAKHCMSTAAFVGYARPNPDKAGRPLQNVAAMLADGKIRHVHVKSLLPTYDVFDETRYFEPSQCPPPIEFKDKKLGVCICEDLWDEKSLGLKLYHADPMENLKNAGAEIIINLSASPFENGKASVREELFSRQAHRCGCPIVYVNQVGANDELIFDGTSCVVDKHGEVIARAKSFEEDLLIVDMEGPGGKIEPRTDGIPRLTQALQLGISDYINKCGFSSVVFGLSGGIDSAVIAGLCANALGGEHVHCLAMPSRYSSEHSVSDATLMAQWLGLDYNIIPIENIHTAFEQAIDPLIAGTGSWGELAGENVQARIRGNLVMAWSNAKGYLPLATGNKSELAVGYCTLYGDMCGGLAPIGDVLKTDVYAIAAHLNELRNGECIPQNIITKAPSAELKPNQTDQDSLPPYDTLDKILRRYVELDMPVKEIIAEGFDDATVRKVVRMVDRTEYKRQQAARVLKVSHRAFGMGRRVPIAQRFVDADAREKI